MEFEPIHILVILISDPIKIEKENRKEAEHNKVGNYKVGHSMVRTRQYQWYDISVLQIKYNYIIVQRQALIKTELKL